MDGINVESLKLSQKWKDKFESMQFVDPIEFKWFAMFTHTLGLMYYNLSQYSLAKEYWEKSLKIRKDLQEIGFSISHDITSNLINLGLIAFSYELNFKKAISYYTESYNLSKEIDDLDSVAFACVNLAHAFFTNGEIANGITYYEESVNFFLKSKSKFILHSYGGLARIYTWNGEYEKAYNYIKKMEQMR